MKLFFKKVAGFTPAAPLKNISHRYFLKIYARHADELHFRTIHKIAFCSTLSFTEHHSKIVSKAKCETAVHNFVL